MINRSKKAKKLLVSKKKLALNVRLGNDSLRTITLRKAFRRDFSKHWQDYTNNQDYSIVDNSFFETPQEASHAAMGASQTAFEASEKAARSHRQYSWIAANEANEYAKMAHAHSANPDMHGEALDRHEKALHYHQAAIKDHDDIAQSHSPRSHLHADARDAHLEAAQVHRDAISEYRDRGVTTNYNPDEPRDKLGKWTKLSSATHATLKSLRFLHHGVEHLEERTRSKVSHLMTRGVTKLPSHIQGLVHGISKALRGGTKLLFANWSMVQRFSDRVAQARGLTPEQSAKIHGVLSSIDLKTFEVFKVGSLLGAHSFHIPAIVTGTLPVATTGYLAWNTVKTGGLAPARAALSIVKDMKDKVIPAQRLAPHTIASGNLPGKMSYNEILSDSIFSNYNTTTIINSTAREDALALSAQAKEESNQALLATPHSRARDLHAYSAMNEAWQAHYDANNGDHRMAIHGHNLAIEHHEWAIKATNSQEAKEAHTKAIDAHRIAIDAHKDADPTINAGQDAANAIVNAMESHHWDDWYDAILVASLDEVGNLYDAIGLANRAYTAHPKYEGEPKEDDAEVVLGKWVKDESILANSTPREDATALSAQARHESYQAQTIDPENTYGSDDAYSWAYHANRAAQSGDSLMAVHHHKGAIREHERAANFTSSGEAAIAHRRAVDAHRIAIDAHKDADTTINALTPAKEQALAVSRKADEDTTGTYQQGVTHTDLSEEHNEVRGDANDHSLRALGHAESGNSEQASHFHLLAARSHERAANTTEHEPSIQAHRNAATSHYIARDAHLDAVNNKRGSISNNSMSEARKQAKSISYQAMAESRRLEPKDYNSERWTEGDRSAFRAARASEVAVGYATEGRDPEYISQMHKNARDFHLEAANLYSNEEVKKAHRDAATRHSIAADAHEDAVNNRSTDPDSYIKSNPISGVASNPNVIFSKYLTQAFTLGLGHTYDASKLTTPNHEDSKYHSTAKSEWLNDITQHPDTKDKLSGIISEGSKRLAGVGSMEDALRIGDTEILRSYGLGKELAKSRLLTVGGEKVKITRSGKVRNISNDIVANALSEGQKQALELTKQSHKETHNLAMWVGTPNEQLYGASNWTGHAYRYASRGQSEEAAKAHLEAAQNHEAAANHPSLSDRPDVRELHTKAAQIHRIARDAHLDTTINASINQEALELSEQAHKESQEIATRTTANPQESLQHLTGTYGAMVASRTAIEHARVGYNNGAASMHRLAAIRHERAASAAIDPELHRANLSVAGLHKIAADAHTDADTTHNIAKGGQSIGNPNSQPLYYWQMKPDDMALLKNFSAVTNSIEIVKNMHDEETREATKGALAATQTAVKASRKLRVPNLSVDAEHHAKNAEVASRHSQGSRDALRNHENAIIAHEQASAHHINSIGSASKNKDAHREASNLHLEAAKMHREAVAHYSDSGVGNWTQEARQASENAHHASQTAIQRSHDSGYNANQLAVPVEKANSLRGYGAGVIAMRAHQDAAMSHQYQTVEHDRNRVRLNNPASTTYSPDQATLHERATDAHRAAAHAHIRAAQAISDSMNRPLDS